MGHSHKLLSKSTTAESNDNFKVFLVQIFFSFMKDDTKGEKKWFYSQNLFTFQSGKEN